MSKLNTEEEVDYAAAQLVKLYQSVAAPV
jgi:hypothetical protein